MLKSPFLKVDEVAMILRVPDDGAMNDETGTVKPNWAIGTLLGRRRRRSRRRRRRRTYIRRLSTH